MKIPQWMQRQFDAGKCSHCKKKLLLNGVKGHTISEERNGPKTKYVHYYIYMCPKCNRETRFKFPTDWEEFIGSMVDMAQAEHEELHPTKKKEEKKPSGISDEEFQSVKEMLDKTEFYEDFLGKIGVQLDDYIDLDEDSDENK